MRLTRITWQYAAAIGWLVFTVALASWWLIFGLSQARHLGDLEGPEAAQLGRVTRMLILEGVMLVAMLVAGGVALLVAIQLEQRRRRDMRAFFMAFTHDLKTSLASLRLQAEALREDLPEAAGNPNLQRMLKDAVRLELQLENALFFTKTDGAVFIEPIQIRTLIDYLRDDWPELQIDVTGDERVRADRRALESILRNLLQNAVVHGRAQRISVELRRNASGAITIVVSDDGIGAALDLATALDRPFVRPTATSGSGVGLFVCRGLLNQMQGEIQLHKGALSGFSVSIELPEAV
ncbi:MAG: HAMP domain-containing sensor histidine kinase [Acidobacteriota bacterium]|nr:HAMP domain-containing sensor histidine kinase [Acidobacteriota bacterium]